MFHREDRSHNRIINHRAGRIDFTQQGSTEGVQDLRAVAQNEYGPDKNTLKELGLEV